MSDVLDSWKAEREQKEKVKREAMTEATWFYEQMAEDESLADLRTVAIYAIYQWMVTASYTERPFDEQQVAWDVGPRRMIELAAEIVEERRRFREERGLGPKE